MTATDKELFELQYPTEPGRVIRARIEGPAGYRSGPPRPHVIVMHGFKGFMHWGFFPELSTRLAKAGLVAVSFNLSSGGIGPDLLNFTDDEGFRKNSFSRELEDADRIRQHVRDGGLAGVNPTRAGILGHSRGGGMALVHAAEHGDYQAVVTWAAIDTVDRWDDATVAAWRERGYILMHNARTGDDHRIDLEALEDSEQNRERLDIRAACERLAAPTLVVHGTSDEGVDPSSARALHSALAEGDLLEVEGAGHTFGAVHPFDGVTPELERVLEATISHFLRHLE